MNEALWTQLQTNVELDTENNETKLINITLSTNNSKFEEITNKVTLSDYSNTYKHLFISQQKSLNLDLTTKIAEITATQPTISSQKKKETFTLKKLKARIKEKTVSLEKALDSYGVIDHISKAGKFYEIQARIYDLESHDLLNEISFSSEEFSASDRKKLVESAIFYWYVGMERSLLGQERRVSEFRLRRIYTPQTI